MEIWIVQGTTGEYSDRSEWVVDAWRTEEEAKARVAALDALLLEHGYRHGSGKERGDWKDRERAREAFKALSGDPNFDSDYTGTNYFYTATTLK